MRPSGAKGVLPKELVLYQYEVCPFCCKVKAFLDYHKVGRGGAGKRKVAAAAAGMCMHLHHAPPAAALWQRDWWLVAGWAPLPASAACHVLRLFICRCARRSRTAAWRSTL